MLSFTFSHSRKGFTLVELIIGITIFSIGLSAIYALLQSTMWNATYSRHEIIVANLLRENIELVKNIRDTNVLNYLPWDSALLETPSVETTFWSGVYLIENNYLHSWAIIDWASGNIRKNSVKLKKIQILPSELSEVWNITKLSLDAQGRYVHDELSSTWTPYAAYIKLTPLSYIEWWNVRRIEENWKTQGYIIDARVIVNTRWTYREYDAKSMITDWIR